MSVVLVRDRGDWLIVAGEVVVARCPEREWAEWICERLPEGDWPEVAEPF